MERRGHSQPGTGERAGSAAPRRRRDSCRDGRRRLGSAGETQALQFLGDTGNVAAKLEAKTKDLGCTVVVSLAALNRVVRHTARLEPRAVAIPGKSNTIEIAAFRDTSELERILTIADS